jgi:hypothetical protein
MTGVRFRETMTGRVSLRTDDPVVGYTSPGAVAARLNAEIVIDDVDEFIAGDVHGARLRAELVIPVLGGRFLSGDGRFELFTRGRDPDGRLVQRMTYEATFENADRTYRMTAAKYLQPGWHLWRDTTTAHMTLTEVLPDPQPDRPFHGAGFVKISARTFVAQLATMRGFGEGTCPADRRGAVLAFAAFFVRGLEKTYLRRADW